MLGPDEVQKYEQVLDFLTLLARELHKSGTPAHRLEDSLSQCALKLGVDAHFLSTPTSIVMAVGPDGAQRLQLLRIEPGEVDLGRLGDFDELIEDVVAGDVDLSQARERIREINASPMAYSPALKTLSFAVAAAGSARVFGGGVEETLMAFFLGLVIGVLGLAMMRSAHSARIFSPLASFIVAFSAYWAASFFPQVESGIVTLASLIVLLPGLTMTVAMTELASGHLMSGTARLAGALTTFLTLAFGVALGRSLALLWAPEPVQMLSAGSALPLWSLWAALLVSPVAFTVLFSARMRELPWIALIGILGFWGARFGSESLGPELGSFLGSLIVGCASNLYARLLDRPASIPLTPGLLLLVPGSLGIRALQLFFAKDIMAGMETGFKTAMIGIAIVGGLLTANFLISPRRKL